MAAYFQPIRKLLSSHPLIKEFVASKIPEWLRIDVYLAQRKRIVSDPRVVLTDKIKSPLGYATFCLVAPYFLLFMSLYLGEAAGMLKPSQLEQEIRDYRRLERYFDKMIEKGGAICERQFGNVPEMIVPCKTQLQTRFLDDRTDVRELLAMLTEGQRVVGVMQWQAWLIYPLMLIMNAYVFARLWIRRYPRRATPRQQDYQVARQAYLLTMGTTMFVPTILAAFALLAIEIVVREEPVMLLGFAQLLVSLSILPLFVAIMLTSQRLYRVLNESDDWRIARPISILLISNALTSIVIIPLVAVFVIMSKG